MNRGFDEKEGGGKPMRQAKRNTEALSLSQIYFHCPPLSRLVSTLYRPLIYAGPDVILWSAG